MMKGAGELLSFIMTMAIGLVITAVGIGILILMLRSADIKEEIAFASTEKLAAAIDEACFLGKDKKVNIDFKLPQRKPLKDLMKVIEFNLPAAYRIQNDGDPHFVVY